MCAGRPAAGMRRLAQLPESEVHWWSTVGSSRQHCKAIVAISSGLESTTECCRVPPGKSGAAACKPWTPVRFRPPLISSNDESSA